MNSNWGHLREINLGNEIQILNHEPEFLGNYSFVYKGVLRSEIVAIKVIRLTGNADSVKRWLEKLLCGDLYSMKTYIRFMASRQAKHLIEPDFLIEWCTNGDANQFLARYGQQMVMSERINLWKGVIEGVIYLHKQNPPIVHGDLKPGNVLIDDFGSPRICDFGLARVFLEEISTGMTTATEHTGTTRYLAPELVESDVNVHPTLSSDLYALGCLGLEIIYLQRPYANRLNNLRGQIFRDIRRGDPPASQTPDQRWPSRRVWPTIITLWNQDPRRRPPALMIADALNRTILTFPPAIMRRIAHFAVRDSYPNYPESRELWNKYYMHLRQLCLTSRDYWAWVTPKLYEEIRLWLNTSLLSSMFLLNTFPVLLHALTKSMTRSAVFDLLPGGYGIHTKVLVLAIEQDGSAAGTLLSYVLQRLLGFMNALKTLIICNAGYAGPWLAEVHNLSTLHFHGLDMKFMLHINNISSPLNLLQRLYITAYHGNHDVQIEVPGLFPSLQELVIEDLPSFTLESHGFLMHHLSSWEMPLLETVELAFKKRTNTEAFDAFFRAHGHRILHLVWKVEQDNGQYLPSIAPLCSNMRKISVPSFCLLVSHPNLEDIVVELGSARSHPPMQTLIALRSRASIYFPALKSAKMKWTYRKPMPYPLPWKTMNSCASFCTGSNNIMVSEVMENSDKSGSFIRF